MIIFRGIKDIVKIAIIFVIFCICLGFVELHKTDIENNYFFHRPASVTRVGIPKHVTTPAKDYSHNNLSNDNGNPNTDTPYNQNANQNVHDYND